MRHVTRRNVTWPFKTTKSPTKFPTTQSMALNRPRKGHLCPVWELKWEDRGLPCLTSIGKVHAWTNQVFFFSTLHISTNDRRSATSIDGGLQPWPVWLSWLGIVLQRERLPVPFPVRAQGCRFGPGWGTYGRQLISVSLSHQCFSPSVSPPFPSF